MKQPESRFRDNVVIPLLKLFTTDFFIKEAKSIVGIPDIIGNLNSKYFALEVKRSKTAKRSKMQEYRVRKTLLSGGFAAFIYPENYNYVFVALIQHCFSIDEAQSLIAVFYENLPLAERKRLIPLLKQSTPKES